MHSKKYLLCGLSLISSMLFADGAYGSGMFYVVNNTNNTFSLNVIKSSCATDIIFSSIENQQTPIDEIKPNEEVELFYNYSSKCAQANENNKSYVNFELVDHETGTSSVAATFKTSIGSIEDPQSSYYHAYPNSPYLVDYDNSGTMELSMDSYQN